VVHENILLIDDDPDEADAVRNQVQSARWDELDSGVGRVVIVPQRKAAPTPDQWCNARVTRLESHQGPKPCVYSAAYMRLGKKTAMPGKRAI
jgi:hypothetical protein